MVGLLLLVFFHIFCGFLLFICLKKKESELDRIRASPMPQTRLSNATPAINSQHNSAQNKKKNEQNVKKDSAGSQPDRSKKTNDGKRKGSTGDSCEELKFDDLISFSAEEAKEQKTDLGSCRDEDNPLLDKKVQAKLMQSRSQLIIKPATDAKPENKDSPVVPPPETPATPKANKSQRAGSCRLGDPPVSVEADDEQKKKSQRVNEKKPIGAKSPAASDKKQNQSIAGPKETMHLVIIGGWKNEFIDSIYMFNSMEKTWRICKKRLPRKLKGHGSAILNSKLYLMGGNTPGNISNPSNNCYKLRENGEWIKTADMN